MQGQPMIVVTQGGCVTDVLGTQNYDTFDWNDFDEDPIAYWDHHSGVYWSTIESLSPMLYKSVTKRLIQVMNET